MARQFRIVFFRGLYGVESRVIILGIPMLWTATGYDVGEGYMQNYEYETLKEAEQQVEKLKNYYASKKVVVST